MSRLIDADALKKVIYFETNHLGIDFHKSKLIGIAIDNAPTIEAEPIKHGKWIPLYPHDVPITNEYKCSVCGLGFDEDEETECVVYDTFKYCPHCGAKMDGVEE